MNALISKQDIENLVEFALTHTLDEAAAEFPMFHSETIRQLYVLTPETRKHLRFYLLLRETPQKRTIGIPTRSHAEFTDASGGSSSWDMIVRLYEDLEAPSHHRA